MNLKSKIGKYQSQLPTNVCDTGLGRDAEDAIKRVVKNVTSRFSFKRKKAFSELNAAWPCFKDYFPRDGSLHYMLVEGLQERALASGSADVAEWLLMNVRATDLSYSTCLDKSDIAYMLESQNAIEALTRICTTSRDEGNRKGAAIALWELENDDALVLIENKIRDASEDNREGLQRTLEQLRDEINARAEYAQRQQSEKSMRDFLQQVVKKKDATNEEIETCLQYLEDYPDLLSGFSRMTTKEALLEMKKKLY